MVLALIQNLIKWILALVLILMFPWLLVPALCYLAWRMGILRRMLLHGRRLVASLGRRVAVLNASVSSGLASHMEGVCYDAPSEDSPYVIVEREGERRMLCAIELKERAAAQGDYGRVVTEVLDSSLQTAERVAFSFTISRRGEVGGLIVLEYRDPGDESDPGAVAKEIETRLDTAKTAVSSAAPLLMTKVCRGRGIALCGLWGLAS